MRALDERPVPVAWGEPVPLPVAPEAVQAGFPSPSQDYATDELDLNQKLIRDRVSTFIWRAAGHSMTGAGIHDGDLLLVDRGVTPVPGHVVVAVVDGEYTVKRLDLVGERLMLRAEAPGYGDIIPGELSESGIWGAARAASSSKPNRRPPKTSSSIRGRSRARSPMRMTSLRSSACTPSE